MINYSESDVEVRWLSNQDTFDFQNSQLIGDIFPQDRISVSTYPNHRFIVVEKSNRSNILHDFQAMRGIKKISIGRDHPLAQLSLDEIVVPLIGPPTQAMSAKFKSLYPHKLHRWFDDGGQGVYQGYVAMGQEGTINTYHSHVFYFTLADDSSKEVARFTMNKNQFLYVIYPNSDEDKALVPQELFTAAEEEIRFGEEYLARTGDLRGFLKFNYSFLGHHWRHYFGDGSPRPPPVLHMWPASHVGQTHSVSSDAGYW